VNQFGKSFTMERDLVMDQQKGYSEIDLLILQIRMFNG
jgi:hypothetical protein